MARFETTNDPASETEEVGGKVREAIKNVTAEVEGRLEAARDAIEELRAKDPQEVLEDAGNVIRAHPFATIGVSIFLGYMVGKAMGRRA